MWFIRKIDDNYFKVYIYNNIFFIFGPSLKGIRKEIMIYWIRKNVYGEYLTYVSEAAGFLLKISDRNFLKANICQKVWCKMLEQNFVILN